MKRKMLMATVVAGAFAFAFPFAAQAGADGDSLILAQAGGPGGASASGTGATGGKPRTGGPGPGRASTGEPRDFTSPDRPSGAAAGATTRGPMMSFSALDTNNDGQISRAEWDAHMGARMAPSGASGGATKPRGVYSPGTARQAQPK